MLRVLGPQKPNCLISAARNLEGVVAARSSSDGTHGARPPLLGPIPAAISATVLSVCFAAPAKTSATDKNASDYFTSRPSL